MTKGSRFCALILVMASSSWAAPNVEITNLQVDPETPQTADSFRVNVKIINTGDQPIEGVCTVEIIQDGITVNRGATSADMLQRDIVDIAFKNGVWVSPSAFTLKQPGMYTARAIWSGGSYRATKEQAFTCTGVDVSIVRNPNPFLSASDLRQTAQRLWQEKTQQEEQARQDQIRQQQAEQEHRNQVEKARQDELRQEREAVEQARLEKLRKDDEATEQARLEKARQQAAEEPLQAQALKKQQAEEDARQQNLCDNQVEQESQNRLREEEAAAEDARQQRLRGQQAEKARQSEIRRQQNLRQQAEAAAERQRVEAIRQRQAEATRQRQQTMYLQALAAEQQSNEHNRQAAEQRRQQELQQQANREQSAAMIMGLLQGIAQQKQERQKQAEFEAQQAAARRQQELEANGDNTLTFRIQNRTRRTILLEFFAIDGSGVWPGDNHVYVLDDRDVHEYKLRGKQGEGIYYGAWDEDDPDYYWGAGKDHSYSDGTYYRCDGGHTPIIKLEK